MDFDTYEKLIKNTAPNEDVSARFYDKAVKTSEVGKDGLPTFLDKLYVEIKGKNNINEIYNQPATQQDIDRFPVEYARYQLIKKQSENGTPLERFAFLSGAEVETLKVRGISTVEALAGIKDDIATRLGVEKEKQAAVDFLAANKGGADNGTVEKLQKELEAEKAKVAKKDELITELKKKLKAKAEKATDVETDEVTQPTETPAPTIE